MSGFALGVVSSILGLAAAALASVGAGLSGVWTVSRTRREYRRAKVSAKPILREAKAAQKALRRVRRPLHKAVANFVNEQKHNEERTAPLSVLKRFAPNNIRWRALEDAGLAEVRQVAAADQDGLAAISGIGRKTAGKIRAAVSAYQRQFQQTPAPLPTTDNSTESAKRLQAVNLDYLDVLDQGDPAVAEVLQQAQELEGQLHSMKHATRMAAWLKQTFHPAKKRELRRRAQRTTLQAAAFCRTDRLERTRACRPLLKRAKPKPRSPAERAAQFQQRYIECCAVLERVFVELGLRPQTVCIGQGGLSDEVAARVEAYPLHIQTLRATLRRYQEFGAKYLLVQERSILGDEMGLGKTLQALAAMTHIHDRNPRARFLAIVPAGLLLNWEREVAKFTPLPAYRLHGRPLQTNLERWLRSGGVAVTSYATLRGLDLGESLTRAGGTIDFCIADEAHFIKNPDAKRSQAVGRVLERSVRASLLTGTPLENRVQEFIHLLDTIRPADGYGVHLPGGDSPPTVEKFHQAVAKAYLRRNQEPTVEAQAVARAHRLGQTRRVLVHRLLARHTCDESLGALLAEKAEVFETYARQSMVKEASAQATESSLIQAVLEVETQRLHAQTQD